MISENLRNELEQVISGNPWYSSSILEVLEQVDETKILEKLSDAHSISEI